jgi:hypothetical protein
MKGNRVENLRWRLGLKHCITVDSVGTGGGMALFWHEAVDVSLIEKHQRYIDVHVREIHRLSGCVLPLYMGSHVLIRGMLCRS